MEHMRICIKKTHAYIYIYGMCIYIFEQSAVTVLIPLQSFLLLPPFPLLYVEKLHRAPLASPSSISMSPRAPLVLLWFAILMYFSVWFHLALMQRVMEKLVSFPKTRVRRSLKRQSQAWSSLLPSSSGFLLFYCLNCERDFLISSQGRQGAAAPGCEHERTPAHGFSQSWSRSLLLLWDPLGPWGC